MAFHEGLSQKKLDAVNSLNNILLKAKNSSGVYVTYKRRYHGKVYLFDNGQTSNIYVGSSNFSASGTKGNIECTVPIYPTEQKKALINFLNDLYSPAYAVTIDRAKITVPGVKKILTNRTQEYWENLETYNPATINTEHLPKVEYDLARTINEEKSNLNIYFGKGRLDRKTGIITPRPWYEVELIADKFLNSQANYPKGDFLAYTDDGLIIPMRTQGDNFKNIRSKNRLQVLGIWLKGKLEKSGALKKYRPVTADTLEEYGNDKLTFYKIKKGQYYMEF